ncbi:MAG: DNA-formamidopyrimidine glycosylase family protein, partial [Patescibacteria group bacterium]
MPELPEIETVKLQLKKVLVGQACKEIKILSDKVIKGEINGIIGRKVQRVERRGKVLIINFGPGLDLGFHFKMTGQLIYIPHPNPSPIIGEGNLK